MASPAAAAPASAAPDCDPVAYGPRVVTSTKVKVTPNGAVVKVTVTVTSNDSGTASGTVDLTIKRTAKGGATSTTSRSLAYQGSPVTVSVPSRPGSTYSANGAYTPSDTTTHSCSTGVASLTVDAEVGGGTENPPGGGPGAGGVGAGIGGILPNTGGPHLWWLLLGLVLAAAGGGTAAYARRSATR